MKIAFIAAWLLLFLMTGGCKDEEAPQESAEVPSDVLVDPGDITESTVQKLLKEAAGIRRGLLTREPGFDGKLAAERLKQLQSAGSEEALAAVSETLMTARMCFEKLQKDKLAGLSPVEYALGACSMLPLLEMAGTGEAQQITRDIHDILLGQIRRLTELFRDGGEYTEPVEDCKQELYQVLNAANPVLYQVIKDFFDAEALQNFKRCRQNFKLITPDMCQADPVYQGIFDIMKMRMEEKSRQYRDAFYQATTLIEQKNALGKLEFLLPEGDYGLVLMKEQYSEAQLKARRENESRWATHLFIVQKRRNTFLWQAISDGDPHKVKLALQQGGDPSKISFNLQTPYAFLLKKIDIGERKEQYRRIIRILLESGLKPSEEETVGLRGVLSGVRIGRKDKSSVSDMD